MTPIDITYQAPRRREPLCGASGVCDDSRRPPGRVFGRTIELSIVNPNAGCALLLATTSLGVYGITLGGWASQSKYSLLGALRSTAQMVSYELSLGMSIVGVGDPRQVRSISTTSWRLKRASGLSCSNPIGFIVFLHQHDVEAQSGPV